jgi:type II secretory pathway predicted ATPase ExeA
MYESFFQLHRRPFPSTPLAALYFPASSTENAFHTLSRLIERAEGPGLLIGGPGTGKTLVCRLLENRFKEAFHLVLLNSAQLLTHRALLQHILFELELPYRGMDEGELLLALMEFLHPNRSSKTGLLLLVDEAHTLPPAVLEGLRTITNVTRNGQPRVHVVLSGGLALEERFAHPELSCFNQRLAARCYLHPLNYDETCAYVHWQIAQAGAPPDRVVAHDAWQPIYQAADGIPRLINQVCDHALMLACTAQRSQLDGRGIEEAWADLQQLPTSWQPALRESLAATDVIEFGGLSIDRADSAATPDTPSVQPCAADEFGPLQASFDPDDHPRKADSPPAAPSLTRQQELAPVPSPAFCRGPSNPFDEPFEDEQVVVDHYASLLAVHSGASPTTMQQREIKAAMQTIFENAAQATESPEDPESTPPAKDLEEQVFQTLKELGREASRTIEGPVPGQAREERADERVEEASVLLEMDEREEDASCVQVIRTLPPDDNDMIIVVDEEHGETPLRSSGGIRHRLEYRQLFSRLRRS